MLKFLCFIFIYIQIVLSTTNTSSVTKKVDVDSDNHLDKLQPIKIDSVCGKTITESQFLLESPNYPDSYPSDLNCELSFKGENCPTYYKFRFIDFFLENSNGCVNDRLEIDLVDALCGYKNGTKSYLAKNGTLSLRFKTNDQVSARGYRILVTRIEDCGQEPKSVQKTPRKLAGGSPNTVNSNLKECCLGKPYNSKHFMFETPHFPASMSYLHDCILQIQKATPDICRIRIVFHFFWFGNSVDCREGSIEIDGKLICGCKKDLKLISEFDQNIKIIKFRSSGLVKNSYSGFLAEVFQDDCPKKVTSDLIDVYNDTALKLPSENQDLKFYSPFLKNSFKGYIYPSPEESGTEREEREFVSTEDINGVLANDVNEFDRCLSWNQAQFNELFYGREIKIEECRSEESRINEEKKCYEFHERRGFIFSPGYPFFYPGNLRACYRFNKHPGKCGVRIFFFDFRIHRSEQCNDDKLVVENRAYCGVELWNRIVILNFDQKYSADLDFITTTPKCAQGFKAYYEYLPCEQIPTEAPVPPPITKIFPVPPSTTERPYQRCGGMVKEEIFTLTNFGGSPECLFVIEKLDEDVCQLILDFEQLSLDCSSEVIKINGKPYCGDQTGRGVTLDVKKFPVEVVYSRFGYSRQAKSFEIRGIQDKINCLVPEPPAQLS